MLCTDLDARLPHLNGDQHHAFTCIINLVMNDLGKLFFLNGPGGTRKTFVYNTVCAKLCSEGIIVLCVSFSGISALLLQGGRTAHSMFKIPVENLHKDSFCSIPKIVNVQIYCMQQRPSFGMKLGHNTDMLLRH